VRAFRLESDVDGLVASSFPAPGAGAGLLARMRADLATDAMDFAPREVDGRLRLSFPIVIVAGTVRGG
jgi:hypothetical protein